MNTYFILIDGVSKFVFHSYTLACLKFDSLKSSGFCGVSIMDCEFNVIQFC